MRRVDSPYTYAREVYKVPAYVGVRVRLDGDAGELAIPPKRDRNVYIRFDGEVKIRGPFHPTASGIEYLPLVGTADRVAAAER
jgi:hypothetical protein